MKHISSFFDRLLKEDARTKEYTQIIQEVCSPYIHTSLEQNSISFNRNILFLKIHNLLKTEIMLHKKEILSQLIEKGVPVHDIR